MEDLTAALYVGKVQDAELSQIIFEHFGHGSESEANTIECGRHGESPAVILKYRGARLMSITSGSGLRELDVDELRRRIASDLIPCEKTVVGRAVLFSPVLVRGYWKTKGVQILPVPAQAPRADILVGKHQPFLLEFEFRTSESASIRIGRRVRRLHELALLLNAVLVPGVVDLGMRARFHWVLKHTTDTTSGITYECAQEGYGYEGLRLEGDSFSPVNGLPK